MKRFISFSGGVESRAMALMFGNQANGIFADTGWEHPELYAALDKVEANVREFHGNDFRIIRVQQKDAEGTGETTLQGYIAARRYYPSPWARFCTRLFKIEPIDDFLRQFEADGAEIMIGLNANEIGADANEADLRTGNHGLLSWVKYSYPLADAGVTRAMCIAMLRAAGIEPNFPPYMKRGGCVGCPFKSKTEYLAMAVMDPERYDEVAELEASIQDRRDRFFHVVSGIPNLKDFKRHANSQLFNPDEVYATINDATKCGVFCNR